MPGFLGFQELLVLMLVLLLLFGVKRMPELRRSLCCGLREFRTLRAAAIREYPISLVVHRAEGALLGRYPPPGPVAQWIEQRFSKSS